jgi:hypothetical protein
MGYALRAGQTASFVTVFTVKGLHMLAKAKDHTLKAVEVATVTGGTTIRPSIELTR